VFAIPMTWFEGELVFILYILFPFFFSVVFYSYSPNLPMLHLLY
jgi:hypothetical protein